MLTLVLAMRVQIMRNHADTWLTHISSLSTQNLIFQVVLGWTPEGRKSYLHSSLTIMLIKKYMKFKFEKEFSPLLHQILCSPLLDHKSRCCCCLFSQKSPFRSLPFQFRIWSNYECVQNFDKYFLFISFTWTSGTSAIGIISTCACQRSKFQTRSWDKFGFFLTSSSGLLMMKASCSSSASSSSWLWPTIAPSLWLIFSRPVGTSWNCDDE